MGGLDPRPRLGSGGGDEGFLSGNRNELPARAGQKAAPVRGKPLLIPPVPLVLRPRARQFRGVGDFFQDDRGLLGHGISRLLHSLSPRLTPMQRVR